ncbi:MAG: hypothetical protein HOP19_21220 [Acidobacteria bacterium]|nr:hypothetical protein [Acidobacteriota bacterium]
MAYFLDLYSPKTYATFAQANHNVSGFPLRHENAARKVQVGDKLICYLTKVSCWFGVLEITSPYFIDATPRIAGDDPYVVRFTVKEIAWLPLERAVPIKDEEVWSNLSFTRNLPMDSGAWAWKVRSSLTRLDEQDGSFLEDLILRQVVQQQ